MSPPTTATGRSRYSNRSSQIFTNQLLSRSFASDLVFIQPGTAYCLLTTDPVVPYAHSEMFPFASVPWQRLHATFILLVHLYFPHLVYLAIKFAVFYFRSPNSIFSLFYLGAKKQTNNDFKVGIM